MVRFLSNDEGKAILYIFVRILYIFSFVPLSSVFSVSAKNEGFYALFVFLCAPQHCCHLSYASNSDNFEVLFMRHLMLVNIVLFVKVWEFVSFNPF